MNALRAAVAAATVALVAVPGAASRESEEEAKRPSRTLRVLQSNPRYFTDGTGKAVYLTGSHVWWNLIGDRTWKVEPCRTPVKPVDFRGHLNDLRRWGHNFIRMWTLEVQHWEQCGDTVSTGPSPWLRTGPGLALDGRPKFNLARPNPAYFRRLGRRVAMAAARRVYVSVMLFEGWGLQWHGKWRWNSHPFNPANNVNGVDGDRNDDGSGTETHTLAIPRVTRIQEAYVRRVVNTVNRYDNVLYEIANESGAYSTAWQYHMVRYVKRYERRKPKRHPVGMTYQHAHGSFENLLRSPADWISPGERRYMIDPPATTGQKVSLSDTDHYCGVCGGPMFVWKNFTRGHNVIYMDGWESVPEQEAARIAMGQTRHYAGRFDLARSRPWPEITETQYALVAHPRQFLVYQPGSGPFWLDRPAAPARYAVEWLETATGRRITAAPVQASGRTTFTPPFRGHAVLFLRRA